MIKVYGLKTCDTCRKALKALKAAGKPHEFIDIRADADLTALAPGWIAALGRDALVNKRSTTWKGLSSDERESADTDAGAIELLIANPSLAKRPVIHAGAEVSVGWGPLTQKALGV